VQEYLKKWIIAPICTQTKNWMHFGPREQENVREMVLSGNIFGKGKELADLATTPKLYTKGLKIFMGLYQAELVASHPESLVDGSLHLWQFFDYKSAHHLELPQKIDHIIEQVAQPNNKMFLFSGFRQLLDSLVQFLASTEAKELFMRRTRLESTLSPEDMKEEARNKRTNEMKYLKETRELLGKGKPFGNFKGQRDLERNERETFREEFEGYEVPDASIAIPRYLSTNLTRKLFSDMVEWSSSKVVLNKKQMVDLSREFVKRLHVKNGHRVQIWGKFLRGHYYDALLKGPARFPYLKADSTEGELFKNRDDKEFRVLKDPHMVNMDNASKDQQEEWDLLQGIAAKIEKHKTGLRYPCFLWFSTFDQVSQAI
jgi:hypothetical protein